MLLLPIPLRPGSTKNSLTIFRLFFTGTSSRSRGIYPTPHVGPILPKAHFTTTQCPTPSHIQQDNWLLAVAWVVDVEGRVLVVILDPTSENRVIVVNMFPNLVSYLLERTFVIVIESTVTTIFQESKIH